jgi:YD repeat-containing protein
MQKMKYALIVIAALAFMAGSTHVRAQAPAQSQSQAQQPLVAQGRLAQVDTDAKTIAIRTDDGTQMQFHYTAETKVTGAEDNPAGLATMSGAQVTIAYKQVDKNLVATQIEVKGK